MLLFWTNVAGYFGKKLIGGWGVRGEVCEVMVGSYHPSFMSRWEGGEEHDRETRTLEALEKESWGVFQWNFGLRKKINPCCTEQDGRSSSENWVRDCIPRIKRKTPQGLPQGAPGGKRWLRTLCSPLGRGCCHWRLEGWPGTKSGRDPKPSGAEGVECAAWP